MPRVFSNACLSPDVVVPISIYMENGVELLIQPRKSNLKIRAVYHHHRLLSPNTSMRTVLLQQIIAWGPILDRNVSSHARMTWLSGLPESDEITNKTKGQNADSPCLHIDMSECDKIQVDYGLTQIFIVRKEGMGLAILCVPGKADASIENARVAISQRSSEDISSTIRGLAEETDRQLDDLPRWKQIALMVATDYALVLHFLEDSILNLLDAVKTQMQKRIIR